MAKNHINKKTKIETPLTDEEKAAKAKADQEKADQEKADQEKAAKAKADQEKADQEKNKKKFRDLINESEIPNNHKRYLEKAYAKILNNPINTENKKEYKKIIEDYKKSIGC